MTTYGAQHDAEYFRQMDRDQETILAMERRHMALVEALAEISALPGQDIEELATLIVKKELRNGKQSQ